MSETSKVADTFMAGVVSGVYDTVDLTTKASIAALERAKALEEEYRAISSRIDTAKRNLQLSPPPVEELPPAQLSADQQFRAENSQRCLTMCSRMTACQIDSQNRVVCGGVVLKPGNTFEGLQANWDLIDTVTGADA
jgi:hypothetical protein